MRILHRYLTFEFIKPFILCIFIFQFMFVVADCFNSLDDFIRNGSPLKLIIHYYIAMIPVTLTQTLPPAILIAVLYIMGDLNRNNEIIAMRSVGLSGMKILTPLIMAGMFLSVVIFTLNETIVPKASLLSFSIKESLIDKTDQKRLKRSLSNVTVIAKTNQMIYARRFEIPASTLHDVIITEDYPDLALKKKISAQRAVYEDGSWTLYQARHTEVNPDGDVMNKPLLIDQETLDIEETPQDFVRQETHTEFMRLGELKNYIDRVESTGFRTSNRLQVDLYRKTAQPLTALIIILVGAPAALVIHRGGLVINAVLALIVIVSFYGFIALSTALGKGGALPPLLAAWLPNAVFAVLGLLLIRKYT